MRTLKIAHAQYLNLGIREFIKVAYRSLFKVDRITIYARELHEVDVQEDKIEFIRDVRKGVWADLESVRNKHAILAWEFSCDLYDGVTDFFIYQNNDTIGHISWIYYANDPNRIIDLRKDEAEVKYSLTVPECRGKGFYPEVLRAVQRYLKSQGYKKLFICTLEDNVPSVRGIEKSGFTFVTTINLIKILGVQVSRRYASRG